MHYLAHSSTCEVGSVLSSEQRRASLRALQMEGDLALGRFTWQWLLHFGLDHAEDLGVLFSIDDLTRAESFLHGALDD